MSGVWSVVTKAWGLIPTWTSLLWSDRLEAARLMAVWWVSRFHSFKIFSVLAARTPTALNALYYGRTTCYLKAAVSAALTAHVHAVSVVLVFPVHEPIECNLSDAGRSFAGIHPTRNPGWAQPVFLWTLQKEMWCSKGERTENVTCFDNGFLLLCCLSLWLLLFDTGSTISALSVPADATAETVWFWLHHYAPH